MSWTNKKGEGVTLNIDQNLYLSRRVDLDIISNEYGAVFSEIDKIYFPPSSKNIIVGVTYHPPSIDLKLINDHFESLLATLKRGDKFCCLMRDYSVDLLKHSVSRISSICIHFSHTSGIQLEYKALLHHNNYSYNFQLWIL